MSVLQRFRHQFQFAARANPVDLYFVSERLEWMKTFNESHVFVWLFFLLSPEKDESKKSEHWNKMRKYVKIRVSFVPN